MGSLRTWLGHSKNGLLVFHHTGVHVVRPASTGGASDYVPEILSCSLAPAPGLLSLSGVFLVAFATHGDLVSFLYLWE